MNLALVAVGVAVVGVGGAAIALQHLDNRALRREVALLRTEVQLVARVAERPAAPAVAAEPGPSATASPVLPSEELAELRAEIAALRKNTQVLTKFAEMAQAAQSVKALEKSGESVATKLVPATQWKNAGKGTPEAATETALWAAVAGEVDVLSNSLAFTDSSRAKADAWFATLSEATRQQYGSAEKIIALMIARDAASLTGMQVLGRKEVTPDDVGLRIRFASDDKTKDDTFLMHRSGDGWRLLLPDQAVEQFARKLSGRK